MDHPQYTVEFRSKITNWGARWVLLEHTWLREGDELKLGSRAVGVYNDFNLALEALTYLGQDIVMRVAESTTKVVP